MADCCGRVGRRPVCPAAPTSPQLSADRVAHVEPEMPHAGETSSDTQVDTARDAVEAARQRLADVPAEVVVVNHVMGLYELAAIHLSAAPPNLTGAALA